PAGTTRLTNTTASIVTQAGGVFGIALTDPVNTPTQLLETATGQNLSVTGINGTIPGSNPAQSGIGSPIATVDVDFAFNTAPATITQSVAPASLAAGGGVNL